jgi:hypothetical protein
MLFYSLSYVTFVIIRLIFKLIHFDMNNHFVHYFWESRTIFVGPQVENH